MDLVVKQLQLMEQRFMCKIEKKKISFLSFFSIKFFFFFLSFQLFQIKILLQIIIIIIIFVSGGKFSYSNDGSIVLNNAAVYPGSGQYFQKLGTGTGNGVPDRVITFFLNGTGGMYAGGQFERGIVEYKNSNFTTFAYGVNYYVNTINSYQGKLFMAGSFTGVSFSNEIVFSLSNFSNSFIFYLHRPVQTHLLTMVLLLYTKEMMFGAQWMEDLLIPFSLLSLLEALSMLEVISLVL